jgi:hypothetical protein
MQTYIVFIHGGYCCVVNGKHQCFVGWCQVRHFTSTKIADHFRNGWDMNNSADSINVFSEYIQEKRYLRRQGVKLAEVGSGRTQIVLKQESMAF